MRALNLLTYFLPFPLPNYQAIAWGFGAAITITILPLTESSDDIHLVVSGVYNAIFHKEAHRANRAAMEADAVVEADASPASSLNKEGTDKPGKDSDSEFEA